MIDQLHPTELRIEMFVRHRAFDCERARDPWGFANADFWLRLLSSNPIHDEARFALVIVMTGAILKYRNDPEAVKGLKSLQLEIPTANKHDEIISIVDRAEDFCFTASERI